MTSTNHDAILPSSSESSIDKAPHLDSHNNNNTNSNDNTSDMKNNDKDWQDGVTRRNSQNSHKGDRVSGNHDRNDHHENHLDDDDDDDDDGESGRDEHVGRIPRFDLDDLICGERIGSGAFCNIFAVQSAPSQDGKGSGRTDPIPAIASVHPCLGESSVSTDNNNNNSNEQQEEQQFVIKMLKPRKKHSSRTHPNWRRDPGGRYTQPNNDNDSSSTNDYSYRMHTPQPGLSAQQYEEGKTELAREIRLLLSLQKQDENANKDSNASDGHEHNNEGNHGRSGSHRRQLQPHPHIISLRGVAKDGSFLVLPRIYATLNHRMQLDWPEQDILAMSFGLLPGLPSAWNGRVDESPKHFADRLCVARDMCDALAFLHERGIVYRDLKPENVGFGRNGAVQLLDLGSATCVRHLHADRDGMYLLTARVGSFPYMAPEVAKKEPYNFKSDVFSLAVLLWEMLSLDCAFSHCVSRKECYYHISLHGERPEVDGWWPRATRNVMQEAWHADPHQRPSMATVGRRIRQDLAMMVDGNVNEDNGSQQQRQQQSNAGTNANRGTKPGQYQQQSNPAMEEASFRSVFEF